MALKTIAQSIADIITKKNNNISAVAERGVMPRDLNIDKSYEILSIRSQPNNNKSISNWYRPTTINQNGGTATWTHLTDNTILNTSSIYPVTIQYGTYINRFQLYYNNTKIWESNLLVNYTTNADSGKKVTHYICVDYEDINDLVLKSDEGTIADLLLNDFVLPSYFSIKDNTKIEIILTYSVNHNIDPIYNSISIHNVYVRYINP